MGNKQISKIYSRSPIVGPLYAVENKAGRGVRNGEGKLQFVKVVREGHTKKMKSSRLDGSEGASHVQWGRVFKAEGIESAKALSQECAWCVWRNPKEVCVSGVANELSICCLGCGLI